MRPVTTWHKIHRDLRKTLYNYHSLRYFKKHFRALRFPMRLQIQTQSFCNGQCTICPYSTLRHNREQGSMTQELFEKIAHQAAEEPLFSSLYFMLQNEPLLDKRVFQWIRYFKSLNQRKRALLVTNGELLSEFKLEEIIESRLDELIISLNAHTERTLNSINTGIDYKKIIKNINFLLSHAAIKSKIVLSFVLTKINEKEICEAIHFWSKKGIRTVVLDISNRAGTLENFHYYRPTGALGQTHWNKQGVFQKYYLDNISRFHSHYVKNSLKICDRPFNFMCILFNGDVIICCHDWRRDPIIGNVNRHLLRSVWNSDEMNTVRRLILEKKYGDIAACRDCSCCKIEF